MQENNERDFLPLSGIEATDAETFARVWARVMPDQSISPVTVIKPSFMQPSEPCPQVQPKPEGLLEVMPESVPMCEMYITELERIIDGMRWLLSGYLALSRRTGARSTRTFAGMAESQRKLLRRCSATYFLLYGITYEGKLPLVQHYDTFPLALREHFLQERRWAHAYEHLSRDAHDPCLMMMFEELSAVSLDHMNQLRLLTEVAQA